MKEGTSSKTSLISEAQRIEVQTFVMNKIKFSFNGGNFSESLMVYQDTVTLLRILKIPNTMSIDQLERRMEVLR